MLMILAICKSLNKLVVEFGKQGIVFLSIINDNNIVITFIESVYNVLIQENRKNCLWLR